MNNGNRRYEYREGRSRKTPVEIIAGSIERIRGIEEKEPTPEMILSYAQDPNDPLHAEFTWDDSVAGELWRLREARLLATCYYTIEIQPTGEETKYIGNYSITIERGKCGYADSFEIMNNESFQRQQLEELRSALGGHIRRYGSIESCRATIRAIRKILARHRAPVDASA